jgi:hypothetical protein
MPGAAYTWPEGTSSVSARTSRGAMYSTRVHRVEAPQSRVLHSDQMARPVTSVPRPLAVWL